MPRKTFTFEGRRYSVTRQNSDELAMAVAEKKLELKQGKQKETNLLVKDWLKHWFETFKEPYVSEKTFDMYKTSIKVINGYIGTKQLKTIRSSDIQNIITQEHKRGMSKSYIDKTALTLNQAFKRAVIDKKIHNNPVADIQKPKMERGKNRALTDIEREAIIAVSKTNPHGAWIRSMLFLGLRPSETTLIQGKDFDETNKTLHVRGTKSEEADRIVPVPDMIINDYMGFRDEEYIFQTGYGNRLTESRMKMWWKAFKREIDIYMGATVYRNQVVESVLADDLKLYCLRHTFGTDCQSAGVPINITKQLMGHSDISVTSKYYIHDTKESRDFARDALEGFYEKKLDV